MILKHIPVEQDTGSICHIWNTVCSFCWNKFQILTDRQIIFLYICQSIKIRNIHQHVCIQKIGIIKYDAFNQMGGKLSFSLALLDENNNGFVLNSVHSADGCYSYTKEIINGECAISLGVEEKQAIEMAMEKTE